MAGRPKFKIDYEVVRKLASIMCTEKEIASFLGCDERTLQRDAEFCRIFKEGKETGKMSLRRMQYKLADKNPTMAIWLGKQYLNQRDRQEIVAEVDAKNNYKELSVEELKKLAGE